MSEAATQAPSGSRAIAILLTLVDEEDAARILAGLGPAELDTIARGMLDVAQATEQDIEASLDQFVERTRGTVGLGMDAQPRLRSVLGAAVGEPRAERLLAKIAPEAAARLRQQLDWLTDAALEALARAEMPPVTAAVIALLSPDRGAEALAGLDPDIQSDILARVARLEELSADAVDLLPALLDAYAGSGDKSPGLPLAGRTSAAKIASKLGRDGNRQLLKSIAKRDKDLARELEDAMLVFADLAAFDGKNLGTLLRAVDASTLTLALRGESAALVDRMLGCLSARAAESIRDELAEAPPVKRSEVEDAQKQIAATARALIADGTLLMAGGDDYV